MADEDLDATNKEIDAQKDKALKETKSKAVVIETTLSCTAAAISASDERSTTLVTAELPVCTVGELPASSVRPSELIDRP